MIAPTPDQVAKTYEYVRDQVLRMKGAQGGEPSSYWRAELNQMDYLLEAGPLVLRNLRLHTHHVTGLKSYDYRPDQHAKRAALFARLDRLRALDTNGLLVPENPALGGFGFQRNGELFNLDTLKFYESLLALDRAGALDPLRRPGHHTVLEIGGGWGGLAYHVKTLFPRTTYVIVDLPELFLFSAVYLSTVFPDARMLFATEPAYRADLSNAEAFDFIFIPNTAFGGLTSERIELALNTVSFQEMTTSQVREYVEHLAEIRCPLLYSLNRHRSVYNSELTSVPSLLAEHYDLKRVGVLEDDYTHAFDRAPTWKRKYRAARSALRRLRGHVDPSYEHILGTLPTASPSPRA